MTAILYIASFLTGFFAGLWLGFKLWRQSYDRVRIVETPPTGGWRFTQPPRRHWL